MTGRTRITRAAALAVMALSLPAASCGTANAAPLDIRTVRLALAGDTLTASIFYRLGPLVDSARFVVASRLNPARIRTVSDSAGVVAVALVAPAEGDADTVTVTPTAYKRGQAFSQPVIRIPYVRPVTPPAIVVDSVTLSAWHWPDSGSIAFMRQAFRDALPRGPLYAVTATDTIIVAEWAQWGNALLLRPGQQCDRTCDSLLVGDTFPYSLAQRNWEEVYWEALAFARHPRHVAWWQQVKACGGCQVFLPIDSTAPGAKL